MTRYYAHTHDPDVDDAEYGEIRDAIDDARPDPAEVES